MDKDGNKPSNVAEVAPINLFTSAMFRGCRVFLNEVQCSSSEMGLYPLRCYTNVLMNCGFSSKLSQMQMYGYYEDRPKQFQLADKRSWGFMERKFLFAQMAGDPQNPHWEYYSKPVPFYCRLLTDFDSCSLPIISDVGVRIELVMNDPAYYMQTKDSDREDKKYRLKVVSATLVAPIKTLSQGLALDLEKRMAEAPLVYPLKRIEEKKMSIAASLQTYTSDNLCNTSVNPERLLVLMVPSKYWEPNYEANPFELMCKFEDSQGADIRLTRSILTINGTPLEQDPANSHDQLVLRAYRALYKNLGWSEDCFISYTNFVNGFFMQLYDLTQSGRAYDSGARQPVKQGNLRLELDFEEPLPYAITLVVLAEMNASVEINKNRGITYNYVA